MIQWLKDFSTLPPRLDALNHHFILAAPLPPVLKYLYKLSLPHHIDKEQHLPFPWKPDDAPALLLLLLPLWTWLWRIFPLKRGTHRSVLEHVSHWEHWSRVRWWLWLQQGEEGSESVWEEKSYCYGNTQAHLTVEMCNGPPWSFFFISSLVANMRRRKRRRFASKVRLIKMPLCLVMPSFNVCLWIVWADTCCWCKEKAAA